MFHGITDDSPETIIKRLEKLKLWQDEQQRILLEKQNEQRILLLKEQQKAYSLYGFNQETNQSQDDKQILDNSSEIKQTIDDDLIPIMNQQELSNKEYSSGPTNQQLLYEESLINNNISKRPFLKRGQGLKARFKIDPDSFKLNNLPKYKYANTHKRYKNSLSKRIKKNCKEEKNNSDDRNFNVKEKLSENNEIANDKLVFSSENYKLNKSLLSSNEIKNNRIISDQEKKTEFNLPNLLPPKEISKDSGKITQNSYKISNQLDDDLIRKRISWAKILDPTNIEPIVVSRLRHNSNSSSVLSDDNKTNLNDTENSSIFELLEKKAEEGSICFDSSTITKWIQNRLKLTGNTSVRDETDNSEIFISNLSKELKNARIHPLPCDIDEKNLLKNSDDSESDDDDDDECSDNDKNSELSNSEIKSKCDNKGHVRFSDNIQINEVHQCDEDTDDTDTDTIKSNEMNQMQINSSMTSTPVDKEEFEKFKKQLFPNSSQSLNDDYNNDLTLINDELKNNGNQNTTDDNNLKKEISEKSEILKLKLKELELEIETFQKHNTELIKMKQEHELEKIKLQQERIDMEEKFNDERIKLEIYLHDERLKLEDEKTKFEKQLKITKQTLNRREKEEITKLKEEIENLQKELKTKENKHIAAQARLRAQIRNLEKELKDLSYELDHLKKEKKKLESENLRLNRQQSNKMLHEINKTITKLAESQTKDKPTTTEVINKNPKSVVAKVISHKNNKPNRRSSSRSIPDLCHEDDTNRSNDSNSSLESDDDDYNDDDNFESHRSNAHNSNITKFITEIKTNKKSSQNINEKSNQHLTEQSPSSSTSTSLNNCENISTDSFKREIINSDGSKDIWYPNGNLKKISSDGMIIRMLYFNKDIKETNIHEGTVKYYYSETNTWHTTYLDGLEIIEFPNGQTEHRYKNGKIEIHFPNGTIRISDPNDTVKLEEWCYSDGTKLIQMKNGDRILLLPNGQKEIHTKAHKRREYPDGTVKLVYPDGSQETRYSNGRVRLKDKDGNLIMDSDNIK